MTLKKMLSLILLYFALLLIIIAFGGFMTDHFVKMSFPAKLMTIFLGAISVLQFKSEFDKD